MGRAVVLNVAFASRSYSCRNDPESARFRDQSAPGGSQRGSVVADFGAGTGNFSTEIAWALPEVSVIHIESNEEMTEAARRKAALVGIKNMEFIRLDLENPNWNLPRLDGAVAIHSLYTLCVG